MGEPLRTCVGCGRKAPKRELVRYTAVDGVLQPDPAGRAPGRGAYTCPRPACLEQAARRRSFTRVLRTAVQVPLDLQAVSK